MFCLSVCLFCFPAELKFWEPTGQTDKRRDKQFNNISEYGTTKVETFTVPYGVVVVIVVVALLVVVVVIVIVIIVVVIIISFMLLGTILLIILIQVLQKSMSSMLYALPCAPHKSIMFHATWLVGVLPDRGTPLKMSCRPPASSPLLHKQ